MKSRYREWHGLAIAFIVVSLIAGGIAAAQTQSGGNYRTIDISITGNATIKLHPTQAEIYLGVVTEDNTATGAWQRNAETMTMVIRAIVDSGISENSIETAEYDVYPRWDWYSDTIIGYTCTHRLKVVSSVSDVSKVIDAAVAAGANRVYNIQFTCNDNEIKDAKRNAFYGAVRDAKEQIDMTADAFGATVLEVVGISMNPVYNYPSWGWYNACAECSTSVPTPIQPGQVEVTSSITVTYRIGWTTSAQ